MDIPLFCYAGEKSVRYGEIALIIFRLRRCRDIVSLWEHQILYLFSIQEYQFQATPPYVSGSIRHTAY